MTISNAAFAAMIFYVVGTAIATPLPPKEAARERQRRTSGYCPGFPSSSCSYVGTNCKSCYCNHPDAIDGQDGAYCTSASKCCDATPTPGGGSCSSDIECSSGVCRGGKCCGPKGQSTGCSDCDSDGECSICSSGYTKTNNECFPNSSVDCVEEQDECTAACEAANQRNYKVTQESAMDGKTCDGPTDCKPGDGQCPTTTTMTISTTSDKDDGYDDVTPKDDSSSSTKNPLTTPTSEPLSQPQRDDGKKSKWWIWLIVVLVVLVIVAVLFGVRD